MDEQLRQATLGAPNIQSPTSPLGSFPELSKLYQSSFQLPQSSGAAGVRVNQAQQVLAERKAAQSADNYRQEKAGDGGFNFYDPSGKPLSAAEYAAATGKKPSDLLANSENPIDIGYRQDYKNLQDYINAKLSSKTNATLRQKAQNIETQVKKAYGINLSKMNPSQLIQAFQSAYPTVYGGNKAGVPVGHAFIPQADANNVDLAGSSGGIGN